jgi:hypothetical protein
MKRKLSFRINQEGDLQVLWCGEDLSNKSWDNIMRRILKGSEESGITLVESRMVEAFPGASAEVSQADLEANRGHYLPTRDEEVERVAPNRVVVEFDDRE